MLRAAIYARFSSDKQRDASIDDQVAAGNAHAERRSYEVVAVYADYAISGRSDDRPQFLQMIDDAKKDKFDVVIVWKIDRFARNMMDQFHYERELKLCNVTLESCKENISGGTMEADMNKGMLAIFAQIRSQQSAVDTMRGMLGKAQQCQYLGVWRFGYSHDGDVITIDPVTAPLAKRIHTDFLAGVGIKNICSWLKAAGIKTYAGNEPGYQFVRGILMNWAYAGWYIWGKKKDDRGKVMKDEYGQPIPLVCVQGGMPAIVTEEMKRACIDLLKFGKHVNMATNYVLSGKLICGETGTPMHGEHGRSQTGKIYYYYACRTPEKRYSVQKELIEKSIVRGIRDMLEDVALCQKLAKRHVEWLGVAEDNTTAIKAAEAEIKALEKQRDNIIDAVANGAPFDTFKSKLDKINADIHKAQGTLEHLNADAPETTEEEIFQFFTELANEGNFTDEQILSAFVNQVVWTEKRAVAIMNFDDRPATPHEILCTLGIHKTNTNHQLEPMVREIKSGSPSNGPDKLFLNYKLPLLGHSKAGFPIYRIRNGFGVMVPLQKAG